MQNTLDINHIETNIPFHKDIRFHPQLSCAEKLFFVEIQSMIENNDKKILPFSARKFCSFFNVSRQTILNWVRHLIELDLIEIGVDYNNLSKNFIKIKNN